MFFFFLVWTKKFRHEKTDLWYAEEVSFHPLTQEILLWAVKCKQALILHLMVVLGHLLPWQALSTTSQCFPSQHQKKLSHADRGGNNVSLLSSGLFIHRRQVSLKLRLFRASGVVVTPHQPVLITAVLPATTVLSEDNHCSLRQGGGAGGMTSGSCKSCQ